VLLISVRDIVDPRATMRLEKWKNPSDSMGNGTRNLPALPPSCAKVKNQGSYMTTLTCAFEVRTGAPLTLKTITKSHKYVIMVTKRL